MYICICILVYNINFQVPSMLRNARMSKTRVNQKSFMGAGLLLFVYIYIYIYIYI